MDNEPSKSSDVFLNEAKLRNASIITTRLTATILNIIKKSNCYYYRKEKRHPSYQDSSGKTIATSFIRIYIIISSDFTIINWVIRKYENVLMHHFCFICPEMITEPSYVHAGAHESVFTCLISDIFSSLSCQLGFPLFSNDAMFFMEN